MNTPNLQLSEVTEADTPAAASLNDSFRSLDSSVQLAVLSQVITAPPAGAVQGDRYIVPASAAGAWLGRTNHVAYRGPEGWSFRIPRPGWRAWSIPDETLLVFTGSEWTELTSGGGGGGGGGGLVFSQTRVDTGDRIANVAFEVDFFNTYEIAANALAIEGKTLEAKFFGLVSTDGSSAPDLRFRMKLGSTVVLDSGDVTLPTGMSNVGWAIDAVVVRNETANFVEVQGQLRIPGVDTIDLANVAPIAVTLSTAKELILSAEWSDADSSNIVRLRLMTVRIDQAATVTAEAEDAVDSDFASVIALVHVEDSVEEVIGDATVTLAGASAVDATEAIFGAKSLASAGGSQNASGLRMTGPGDYFVFPAEFTIEGWFFPTSLGDYRSLFDGQRDYPAAGSWSLIAYATGALIWFPNAVSGPATAGGGAIVTNVWQHIAVSRDALNVVRIFVDGINVAQGTNSGTVGAQDSSISHFNVSRGILSDNWSFPGYIEEIRVTKGVCRYTANFTPPIAPFPDS